MATRPPRTDSPTTALELLQTFVETPTYRSLGVERQCDLQEALEYLSRYAAAAPGAAPFESSSGDGSTAPPASADLTVRPAGRGEFTTDADVN